MRDSLDAGKRVVAITADVRHFYHRTSPDFLLNGKYLTAVGLAGQIEGDARRFTKALIDATCGLAEMARKLDEIYPFQKDRYQPFYPLEKDK